MKKVHVYDILGENIEFANNNLYFTFFIFLHVDM